MRTFLTGIITSYFKFTGGTPGTNKVLTSDTDGVASWNTQSVTVGSTSIALGGTAATLAGVTLTTPTISATGFTNAQHAHTGATSGGQLTDAALSTAVTVVKGGTGNVTATTAYGLQAAGTTATSAHQTLPAGATTEILVGGGASALPVWTTAQGSGPPVRATSPTIVTPTIASFANANHTHADSAGGGQLTTGALTTNAVSSVLLSATENTDFISGTALTVNTWTDFKGNQNFTVTTSGSIILVYVIAGCIIGSNSVASIGARVVIDSAGTPVTRQIGASRNVVAAQFTNPFSGAPAVITGLSAGVHTVKTQVLSDAGTNLAYCRTSTVPNTEFYTTIVVELKK